MVTDGMHRIRHFGILANGCRARTLESVREALGSIGCPDEYVDDHAPEGERERDQIAEPVAAPWPVPIAARRCVWSAISLASAPPTRAGRYPASGRTTGRSRE